MTSNPAQIPKKITFRLPLVELDRLEEESRRTGRTKTDILREFIRTLPRTPDLQTDFEKK
ncbi:MAG: ribbon-helix-helix protein, CopG family [Coleofasciculaceae cyanobacterium]